MTDHSSPANAEPSQAELAACMRDCWGLITDGMAKEDFFAASAVAIQELLRIRAQSTPEPVTYQLRFRRESGEWSEWQNVVSPWDGSRNPAWEYRPLYAAFSSPYQPAVATAVEDSRSAPAGYNKGSEREPRPFTSPGCKS